MPEQVVKLKKKQWYKIIAPSQFNNIVLGETLAQDQQSLLGKTLRHNLMNLTNDIKRQNINIHFKIVEVESGNGKTSIIGYEITPFSIKRFVRRSSEKIDLSFNCETSDNVLLRIKLVLITKSDVKGSIAAKLRHSAEQFLVKNIKKVSYEEFISDLIAHKVQAAMRENLSKIYPLKICEIRYAGIEARERHQEAKAEVKEEKVVVKEEK